MKKCPKCQIIYEDRNLTNCPIDNEALIAVDGNTPVEPQNTEGTPPNPEGEPVPEPAPEEVPETSLPAEPIQNEEPTSPATEPVPEPTPEEVPETSPPAETIQNEEPPSPAASDQSLSSIEENLKNFNLAIHNRLDHKTEHTTTDSILPPVESADADLTTADFEEKKKSENESESESESETAPQTEINVHAEISHENKYIKMLSPLFKNKKLFLGIGLSFLITLLSGIGFCAYMEHHQTVLIQFVSNPEGADVTLDGKYIGISPVNIKIKKGYHIVQFDLTGHETVREKINIINQHQFHTKTLVPINN